MREIRTHARETCRKLKSIYHGQRILFSYRVCMPISSACNYSLIFLGELDNKKSILLDNGGTVQYQRQIKI